LAVTPRAIPRLNVRLRRGRAARQPTAWPSARRTGAVAAPARATALLAPNQRLVREVIYVGITPVQFAPDPEEQSALKEQLVRMIFGK